VNGFAASMSAILVSIYTIRMHHKLHEEEKMKEKRLYKISMLIYISGTNFSSERIIGATTVYMKTLKVFRVC
jgi:hypothetical protein